MKLLAEEAGSDLAAELWDACDAAVASRLDYPEVRAALAAAARNHDLGDHALDTAGQAWGRLLGRYPPGRAHPQVPPQRGASGRGTLAGIDDSGAAARSLVAENGDSPGLE